METHLLYHALPDLLCLPMGLLLEVRTGLRMLQSHTAKACINGLAKIGP